MLQYTIWDGFHPVSNDVHGWMRHWPGIVLSPKKRFEKLENKQQVQQVQQAVG